MIIQLNTDKNIQGTENLESYVSERIKKSLKHYTDHVTRVEIHLSDQNADKGGADDIMCKIEARIQGKQPVTVNKKADNKEKALAEAIDSLKAALGTVIGKMKDH